MFNDDQKKNPFDAIESFGMGSVIATRKVVETDGIKTPNNQNDLEKIKLFLSKLKHNELYELQIQTHRQKKQEYKISNYHLHSETLYVDKTILEKVKQFRKELLQSPESLPNQSLQSLDTKSTDNPNALKNKYDNFKINYRDENKEYIKKVLGEIDDFDLKTLELRPLDATKKDQFQKPRKTNYKRTKKLNVLYYRPTDKKYINFFLTKNNKVRKLRSGYLINSKKDI